MPSDIIVLERELIKSEAFRSLTAIAIIVYLDFRMKCVGKHSSPRQGRKKEFVILNNGQIEYCFSEALKKGITRTRFNRALKALVEKGFIDISHLGMGGTKGDKNKYAISDRWKHWGTARFEKVTKEKDTREGRGFAVYWRKKKSIIDNANDTPSSISNVTPLKIKAGME
ncbi:hypothetical protein ACFLZT_00870 [Thermodesulfobacteriota bacterium]